MSRPARFFSDVLMPSSDSKLQPHRDAGAWPGLIESLSVEAILVLISTWMGRNLRRRLDPEDLWQETLYCAWRDRDQHEWTDLPAYRRWILGIAKNRVREASTRMRALKRGGGEAPRSLATFEEGPEGSRSPAEFLPPHTVTPSRIAALRERRLAIETSLQRLPGEYREALRLRLFEQRSLKEVAGELGVSLATAKKRVYLGARLYRQALKEVLSRTPGTGEGEE